MSFFKPAPSAGEALLTGTRVPAQEDPQWSFTQKTEEDQEEEEEKPLLQRVKVQLALAGPGLIAVAILPSAIFAAVMAPFAFSFWSLPWLHWNILSTGFALSLLFWAWPDVQRDVKNSRFWRVLAVLCLLASLTGAALGFYDHSVFIYMNLAYKNSPTYLKVKPTARGGAFQDSGIISFAGGARVDPTMSVGYRDVERYCVAPIFDRATMSKPYGKRVSFWAVGVDCCRRRGMFRCGPVWNTSVSGGLAVVRQGWRTINNVAAYKNAMEQAAATYELVLDENPVFVRWGATPKQDMQEYWDQGVAFFGWAVLTFVLLNLLFGIWAAYNWQKYFTGELKLNFAKRMKTAYGTVKRYGTNTAESAC
eukprot:TRINITY_DN79873_c0_g1_i1.p1 TRINITY_DN79873_c0_g1~~TRINITY_DN79873_c0_g1_i1.p1  ORF type:complete len:364 (+),score=52.12 TRINITY_DN79873_c0_g1_i1:168-1259(+)